MRNVGKTGLGRIFVPVSKRLPAFCTFRKKDT